MRKKFNAPVLDVKAICHRDVIATSVNTTGNNIGVHYGGAGNTPACSAARRGGIWN